MAIGAGEPSFQQARSDTLRKIRDDAQVGILTLKKDSAILLQDCLSYEMGYLRRKELSDEQKRERMLLQHGAEMTLEVFADFLDEALAALESGRSLYDLLGQSSLPAYAALTGGDAAAGALSAVEDVTVLLMSCDMKALAGPVVHEINTAERVPADLFPVLETVAGYSAAMAYDTILMGSLAEARKRQPAPVMAEYEPGRAPAPQGALGRVFKSFASLAHHSLHDERRARKTPKLWPPLKTKGPAVSLAQGGRVAGFDQGSASVSDSAGAEAFLGLRRYDPLGFHEGYRRVMEDFFITLQDRHFDAMSSAGGARPYSARLKIVALHEKKVRSVAQNVVSELRERIGERIREGVRAIGADDNVFSRGAIKAHAEIEGDIQAIKLQRSADDFLAERILRRLQADWRETLREVISRTEEAALSGLLPDEPSSVVESLQPGP